MSLTLVELITAAVSSGFLREMDPVHLVEKILKSLLVEANSSIFGCSSRRLCNLTQEGMDLHEEIGVLPRDVSNSATFPSNNYFSSLNFNSISISNSHNLLSSKSFLSLVTSALLGDILALASNVDRRVCSGVKTPKLLNCLLRLISLD